MPRTPRPARAGGGAPTGPVRGAWSVRTHLWTVLVVAAVVLAASLGSGYSWSADAAEQRVTAEMAERARIAADEITDALSTGRARVAGLAGQEVLLAAVEGATDCALVVGEEEAFPDARVEAVGTAGQIACSSQASLVDLDADVHGGSRWFADALAARGLTVHWPAEDAVTGRTVAVVAQRLVGPDGEPAGVVALFLDAGRAARPLATDQALGADAALTVLDRTTGSVVSATVPPHAAGTPAGGATRTTGRWRGPDGVVRVHASADVDGLPWRVQAGTEHETVVESARGTLVRQSLAGGGALLLLAVALLVLDRRVAGPLHALTRGAVRARDDAGDARVPEAGTAELVELARAYNAMLDVRAGQEARLAYQASHDRLTGLPDADWARARLGLLLARTDGPGRPGVLHVGVTGGTGDTVAAGLGPEVADRVQVEVAARLRSAVRPGDVVARAGREGFLVVCEGLVPDEAAGLAQALHTAVAEPMGWPAPGVVVRTSTGIDLGSPGRTAESLLRGASTALAHAQSHGRVWSVFDESMRARATHQLETEHRLRRALADDELVVHYQPIVDLASGRVTGAEALVRWEDPERGLVPPLQFIPVAERSGQVAPIGELVLTRACRQAALWQRTGRPFVVSVNVAAAQLLDDDFAATVARVLRDSDLEPESLCLEVTESAVVRRAGGGAESLHRLRRLGVHVAVDDFGTGYSSLSYLQHLPITSLKVDRSFVARIEHDARDRHLVDAVLGMARALDLAVVAEGVETAGQRDLLEDLGCASGQGYLFGRPCPAEEFGPLLTRVAAGR